MNLIFILQPQIFCKGVYFIILSMIITSLINKRKVTSINTFLLTNIYSLMMAFLEKRTVFGCSPLENNNTNNKSKEDFDILSFVR